jgi:transketolase
VSTLKPFDAGTVLNSLKRTGLGVTCEEHSVIGGLYSAVAESLAGSGIGAVVKAVAVMDRFAESGPYEEMLFKFGLSAERIEEIARGLLAGRAQAGEVATRTAR